MIRLLLIFIAAILFYQSTIAQKHDNRDRFSQNKLKDLERIKIIEALELNEEEAIKFFSRRIQYQSEQKEIMTKRDSLYASIRNKLKKEKFRDTKSEDYINQIFDYENQIIANRKKFIESLSDILTPTQKVKYVIFEHAFRQEIQKEIQKRGRRFRE